MVSPAETPAVRFENIGEGTEIWGGTQANFIILRPGADREVAIILNDPAIDHVAAALGQEATPEFAADVTHRIGQLWLERQLAANRPIDAIQFLSRASIESAPELIEALRT
jgi:hypothetical protein